MTINFKSKTQRFLTSSGTAYLTLCYDEENKPISLIANISKTGSELRCFSEGLGRLVTMGLAKYSPEELARELEGIGSSNSSPMQPSLPHCISEILRGEEIE